MCYKKRKKGTSTEHSPYTYAMYTDVEREKNTNHSHYICVSIVRDSSQEIGR